MGRGGSRVGGVQKSVNLGSGLIRLSNEEKDSICAAQTWCCTSSGKLMLTAKFVSSQGSSLELGS